MDKIICLVGESGSGKTTLCKKLEEQGYNIIKSYTTRKPRNKDEYGHIFVNENNSTVEMFKWNTTINHENKTVLCGYHPSIIAYTFFDNSHYWATKEQYQEKSVSIYVVDPAGVKYLKEKVTDAEILVIYLKSDKKVRLSRMLKERDPKAVYDRLKNDREAFRIIQCDYCVDVNREVDEVLKDIIHIIKEVDTNNE